MIDTHCHLSDKKFVEDLDEVIKRAKGERVGRMIVPSVNLSDAKKVAGIAEKNEGVYALVGVHPETVISDQSSVISVDDLVEIIESSKKVVGIGEVGLDFYWDKEKKSKEAQTKLLEMQLRLAEAMRLPVVIHMREAEKEMMEVLEKLDHLPEGQFHCWSGSEDFLKWVLEKGFFVSFCGNVTYKSNSKLRELAKEVPVDRLLLETDSPYLAPDGERGKRNEPINVRITARYLADLLGKSFEELERETDQNAEKLFNLLK